MPQITITDLSEQEVATLTLTAQIRGTLNADGSPNWNEFYKAWHADAYAQVQRTAGTMIADDPVLSAQLMELLQAKLSEAANSQPAEPTEDSNV